MGKLDGFMYIPRAKLPKRPVAERLQDYKEINQLLDENALNEQAARCMDCGIPYCHMVGCPLHNRIPEFNDAVYNGNWKEALELLLATDDFPEFTGRVCPAPCEGSCTVGINDPPVTINHIELQIIERAFAEGWIKPQPAGFSSGYKVAIVGSGPAGLAAANRLARSGHVVTVFEKSDRIGGLLRYGIPDFKLAKTVIDRRIELMKAEGIHFETNVRVGVDISAHYLLSNYDALVLTVGAGVPRMLHDPGFNLDGIHLAMDYLGQQNRINAGDRIITGQWITSKEKHVVVIGGGDTGSDVVGTANRQGALSVTQVEILPEPPDERPDSNPWPTWPLIKRTSSSHEEGCQRLWNLKTVGFDGKDGKVCSLRAVKVDWSKGDGQPHDVPDSEIEIPADLVIVAAGFLHPEHDELIKKLDIELTDRGNFKTESQQTSNPNVFAAGDCVSGPSLVVTAMASGVEAAKAVQNYLESK